MITVGDVARLCALSYTVFGTALNCSQCFNFKFIDISLQDDPAAILLNLTPMSRKQYHKSLFKHLLNAAQACISSRWKHQTVPMVAQWIAESKILDKWWTWPWPFKTKRRSLKTRWFHWNLFCFSDKYLKYVWAAQFPLLIGLIASLLSLLFPQCWPPPPFQSDFVFFFYPPFLACPLPIVVYSLSLTIKKLFLGVHRFRQA